jgi:uncharacterized coiled-coil DUF342 family protein
MPPKRRSPVKRVRKIGRVRRTSDRLNVTRAEFDALISSLNERGEIINEIQRNLQTQFTRIAQLQHELDDLKKSHARSST